MDSIKGKFTHCNFRKIRDLTEEQKQEFLDLQIALAPVVSKEEECEYDVIADIFQKAIKRKGLTKEQVQNINKEMLEELRKNIDEKPIEKLTTVDLMLSSKLREQYYKYWDNKLAEDRQNPKLKEIFEEEDKIYKGMRELEKDEYKKWEETNDRNSIR